MPTAATPSPATRFSSVRASTTLAENIIHLVLARLARCSAGARKASPLFIVPKFIANPDQPIGERNKIFCTGLEHKMGIHSNATCQIALDGARAGWLVSRTEVSLRCS